MDNYDISVIVPVYNCESYLNRSVESILAQEAVKLEIILIDDGSKDNSLAICRSYQEKYPNITVIASENSGPAAARNKGICAATGEYLAFVDSDDFIAPQMYSQMLKRAKDTDADVAVCGFARVTPSGSKSEQLSKILKVDLVYSGTSIQNTCLKSYYQGIDPVIPSLCNKLYRREMIQDHALLIDENYVRAEDYWFNFEVFQIAKTVCYLHKPFYCYWNNESSVMHTYRENQFEQSSRTHEILLKKNKEFQFEIDKNRFYLSYLYETAVILKDYYKRNSENSDRQKRLREIVNNPVYQDAVKYRKYLPKHIQLLSWQSREKMYWMLDKSYCVWVALSLLRDKAKGWYIIWMK